jgi:ATP synthase protein I
VKREVEVRQSRPRRGEDDLARVVGRKERRKLAHRRERSRGIWFGLGMFGLVGWAVAIPTVAGTLLGYWIDSRVAGRVSWTLSGLFLGVVLGCFNAWYWVRRESRTEDGGRP